MNYTNKFVEWLNGSNTIAISGVSDFNTMSSLCKKIGINFLIDNYWELLNLARMNGCAINYTTVLVEYQVGNGPAIGYSHESSEKWFGMKPWTVKEVRESIKNGTSGIM